MCKRKRGEERNENSQLIQFWYNGDYLENVLSREWSHFFHIFYVQDTHILDETKEFLSLLFFIATHPFRNDNKKEMEWNPDENKDFPKTKLWKGPGFLTLAKAS